MKWSRKINMYKQPKDTKIKLTFYSPFFSKKNTCLFSLVPLSIFHLRKKKMVDSFFSFFFYAMPRQFIFTWQNILSVLFYRQCGFFPPLLLPSLPPQTIPSPVNRHWTSLIRGLPFFGKKENDNVYTSKLDYRCYVFFFSGGKLERGWTFIV